MKKLGYFLALLAVTGCSARTGTVPTVTPTGQVSPKDQAGSYLRVALPRISDLKGAAISLNTEHHKPSPPALRVEYSDQRTVIAKVLDMIAAAEPVPDVATRYIDHSPVFTLVLTQGGGVSIAPAYECATAPERSAPADCHRVEGQVTFFPAADAKPVRLRSPELVAWLAGGWEKNWPIASPPDSVVIKVEVRGGDTPDIPPISGAEVTFESESGTLYQLKADAEGKAELTVPATPVVTPSGSRRCAAYRVTVAAQAYKTNVIESLYVSPWAGGYHLTPALLKGNGILRTTVTGEKCLPDQQPGL